jgi:hypothetical protein
MRWAEKADRMWKKRTAYRLLVGQPEVKRPRLRCVERIKKDLVEIGLGAVDWIGQAQDRSNW